MSAPNEGRQSPEPERQTGAQQQDPPASGKAQDTESKDEGKGQTPNLESNPKHVLQDAADDKVKKGER